MFKCGKILFFLLFLLAPASAFAELPTVERLPGSGGAPLDILGSEPTGFYAITTGDFKNKLLLTWSGSTLTLIDLETWAEAETQPDAFTTSIADVALLGDGVTVVVALTSGDVATIDLSDETTFANTEEPSDDEEESDPDSRQIDASDNMDSAGISAMAVSPDENSDTVFLVDEGTGTFYELDLSSEDLNSLEFASEDNDGDFSDDFTPTDIVYADTGGGKLLITTSAGMVLLGSPGNFTFSEIELSVRDDDTEAPNLSQAIVTPNQEHAFILDSDNDAIWVFSFASGDFVDEISTGTSLDPITFDADTENATLTDIAFITSSDGETVYGYVSGANGVSIVDASDPDTKAESKTIDTDSATADIFEPITMSGAASQMVALSDETGTLLSANGDATISVLSDNPFVTISAISTEAVTVAAPTFALTFQTDEAGTYTVVANSDPLAETGTELIASTTVDTADTDTTTAEIDINDFDREVFQEGDNKVFIFVTDADGNTGWDAAFVNIDRPPDALTLNGASFGDQKILVSFVASEDDDIATYTILAEPAANQDAPSCPGDLTFASGGTITDTVDPDSCTAGEDCTGTIDGLANAVTYCIAMTATDESDQTSETSVLTDSVTPEATVGPAEFLGQTGCALTRTPHFDPSAWAAFLALPIFMLMRLRLKCGSDVSVKRARVKILKIPFAFLAAWLCCANTVAAERTPQRWTFETRVQHWFPTRSEIKPFFGGCCNLTAEFEGGILPMGNQLNLTAGVGIGYNSGPAVGVDSGEASGDRFKMLLIPFHMDAIYRFDYKEDQWLMPYVRAGLDSILFRESGAGNDIWANRFGFHGGLGLGLLLDNIESLNTTIEGDYGVNDVYLTLEGRYAQIDNLGATGMDFSGFSVAVGLLFEF